jgi:Protein of unknown function (DUF2800)
MTTHAKLSPSSRLRWGICPGSVAAESKYPWVESGPAAKDGTHTHSLLEHCIKNEITNALVMVDNQMSDHDGSFIVQRDRAERVNVALDYIADILEECPESVIISETRVNPEKIIGRPDMNGTADIQIISDGLIEIIDYKDGMGYVSANDNKQLEIYAIGALAALSSVYSVTDVKMTIIQPKNKAMGKQHITSSVKTVQQMLELVPKIQAEYDAVHSENPALVPGESQCKYCKAKGSCNALNNNVMEGMGIEQGTSALDIASQAANLNASEMSDEKLLNIIESAPLLRNLLDAAETEAFNRIKGGKTIKGLKIVMGRGSRKWSFPESEMAEKLVKMGIPKKSIYETSLVSPAKAEKLTWEKTDGTKVSLSERQIKRLETDYIIKAAGKHTIALESDSRQAVVFESETAAVSGMFAAIPDFMEE